MDDRKRADKIYGLLDFHVAGEEENKRLIFYLILSCYHPELVSFIFFRGDSSAGKNHIIDAVFNLFPTEHLFIVDSATPAALNYDQELMGKKMIYLRELNEGNPIMTIIKAMYNPEGYIHKETIRDAKTKELMVKTHAKTRIGAITTLSFENLQVDLINRSWVLIPDQTHDQTTKVINYHLRAEGNAIKREMMKREIAQDCLFVSQAIKNLDFSYDVYVPFTERLSKIFPSNRLNTRRDIKKMINLIKIICLWNQKNRRVQERAGKRWLFAEYFDLQEALAVSQNLFINTVLHIDDTKKAILELMDSYISPEYSLDPLMEDVQEEEEKYFTITEVHAELRSNLAISRRTVQRKMNELFYEGYLFRDKKGGSFRFKLLKSYEIIDEIELETMQDEVIDDIESAWAYWSNYRDDDSDLEGF